MEQTNTHFKALFINKLLKDIKFYNTKVDYLALDERHKWVLQGGIEFIFDDYMISLGWNAEMQLYEMIEGDLELLIGEMDVFDIELDQHEEFQVLKGKKIEEISFNWNWYQKMDDEMELTDEKVYIPQEIRLTFEDKSLLQVATVLFHLKRRELTQAIFDPQGNLLITLNQPVEIMETFTEPDLEQD